MIGEFLVQKDLAMRHQARLEVRRALENVELTAVEQRLSQLESEVQRRLAETQEEADRRWHMLMEAVQEQYDRLYSHPSGVSVSGEPNVQQVNWKKEGF